MGIPVKYGEIKERQTRRNYNSMLFDVSLTVHHSVDLFQ